MGIGIPSTGYFQWTGNENSEEVERHKLAEGMEQSLDDASGGSHERYLV